MLLLLHKWEPASPSWKARLECLRRSPARCNQPSCWARKCLLRLGTKAWWSRQLQGPDNWHPQAFNEQDSSHDTDNDETNDLAPPPTPMRRQRVHPQLLPWPKQELTRSLSIQQLNSSTKKWSIHNWHWQVRKIWIWSRKLFLKFLGTRHADLRRYQLSHDHRSKDPLLQQLLLQAMGPQMTRSHEQQRHHHHLAMDRESHCGHSPCYQDRHGPPWLLIAISELKYLRMLGASWCQWLKAFNNHPKSQKDQSSQLCLDEGRQQSSRQLN